MQKTLKNRTIFCRDNIEVLRGIDSGTIDLVYLDPPFNKNKNFFAPIGSASEGASFKDTWGMADIKDEWHGLIADAQPLLYHFLSGMTNVGEKSNKYYLIYMGIRLLEIHRVLKDTGSMYLHCDPTMSHYLKLLCDIIFGQKNFLNEIIWCYKSGGVSKKHFARKHDVLLFYCKSNNKNKFNIIKEKSYGQSGGGQGGKVVYYKDEKGTYSIISARDWWNISMLSTTHSERLGYPTQKPLALLDRIIKVSSNEGDIVLDPFCGCATACISAELNNRQWIGIDVSKMAYHLVNERMKKEVEGNIDFAGRGSIETIFREDIPERTDTAKNPMKKSDIKHTLYGKQEGKCNGCNNHFEFRHFHIDHIIPKSKGGADGIENFQLLCGHCNIIKSDNDMAYLRKRLKEMGVI